MNRRQFLYATLASSLASSLGTVAAAASSNGPLEVRRLAAISKELSAAQRRLLDEHGFVLSSRTMPSFGTAYEWLYRNDLPLFVSADSLLHAVHRAFDDILKVLELEALIPSLATILTAMRRDLAGGTVLAGMAAETLADVDLYLAVALSLLEGAAVAPVAGADPERLSAVLGGVEAAGGMVELPLFGAPRLVDASQFTPRGHYTDDPALTRYFRAMMWLGRIELRLIEQVQGELVFQRSQVDAAVGLRLLMDQPTHEAWLVLDRTIGQFVGPYDSLSPPLLDDLMAELEIDGPAALAALSDQTIRAALEALPGGEQQILSHLVAGLPDQTLALSRTFLLLGQRYTIDSHVLSLLVYDRVGGGSIPRLMPSPLDVAHAVLGNELAGTLLAPELARYPYAADLAKARAMVEARTGWQDTLYDLWLAALRTLSETPAEAASVAHSEAWERRILSTQLASWAELRHDTILYNKQSYTSMILCEHPDAWVDPYPAFYAALGAYAERGLEIVDGLALGGESRERVRGVFATLQEVSTHLEAIARGQVHGQRINPTHLRFINEVVRSRTEGCGALVGAEGWYPRLFLHSLRSMEFDPTIADVHTQPTDEVGNPVGRILHVATGVPRICVVIVETCDGPRAYAGVVSSYHEKITEGFVRLADEDWSQEVREAPPVAWMADLIRE